MHGASMTVSDIGKPGPIEMNERDLAKPIRVVCVMCATNAVVHYQRRETSHRSVLIWAECHGEHLLGYLDDNSLRYEGSVGLLADIGTWGSTTVESMHSDAEAQLVALAERVDMLQRFMKASQR